MLEKRSLVKIIFFIIIITYFIDYCIFNSFFGRESEVIVFNITLKQTFENRNFEEMEWNLTEEQKRISLFMNNSWQTVSLNKITPNLEKIYLDIDGNIVGIISIPKETIFFGENLTCEASYSVLLKSRKIPKISFSDSRSLSEIPKNLEFYCSNTGPWQINNSEIQSLVYEIVENQTNVLSIVQKLIIWIKKNINYGSSDVPRYPNETLIERVGDCDDQANLFITMCRIIGIPAYLEIGCIYLPNRSSTGSYWEGHRLSFLKNIGWHAWAIVYLPPWGWLPIDLTFTEGDLTSDPINAISGSAIIRYPTIQYMNITNTDYVKSYREFRDFLKMSGNIFWEYDEIEKTEIKTPSVLFRYFNQLIVFFSISILSIHHEKKIVGKMCLLHKH